MAASGFPGEDQALRETVVAVAELCLALQVAIPVGKDSLSMRTAWRDADRARTVVAPVSLIVSAFSPVGDVRRTLTPQLLAEPDTRAVSHRSRRGPQPAGRLRPRAGFSPSPAVEAPDVDYLRPG